MNWEKYEEVVKSIYEKLGAQHGVKVVCFGRECKVKGKSGVEHQVDVLLEHSDGVHTYRTAIECKYWNKRRPKEDVTKLATILEDANLHKGIIVSKLGFTEDAQTLARYKNIELVELREPTEDDWKGRIKDIHLNFVFRMPIPTDFRIDIVDADSQKAAMPSETLDTSSLVVVEPGKPEKTLKEIIHEMIASADQRIEVPILVRREFGNGTVSKNLFGRTEAKVAAIQFMLGFDTTQSSSIIKGADHVAMIMRSLFDKRRFIISPDGEIRESEA